MKLRHVGIVSLNLVKLEAFYCDHFGYSVEKKQLEQGEFIATILGIPNAIVTTSKLRGADGSIIEILQFQNESKTQGNASQAFVRCSDLMRSGITHIAITVPNLDQIHQKLLPLGVVFHSSPLLSPNGKAKVAFCRDPDGNFLELVEEIL